MIHFSSILRVWPWHLLGVVILLNSCHNNQNGADAYGNFESTPVFISPDIPGKLAWLSFEEGDHLDSGQLVAIIDTTPFSLSLQELESQQKVVYSRIRNIEAQVETLEVQMKNLVVELQRAGRLYENGAVTDQVMDDLKGKRNVLTSQISALEVQKGSVHAELEVLEQKKLQVLDKKTRCFIRNPMAGTVLEKYMEQYEMAVAGRPIYKLADLSTLELKVYVDALELKDIRIGDPVIVRVDRDDKNNDELPGVVSWIASQAEFTPKIIQTKEERVNLVYAVKILVENDGRLKIGLPGEVVFQTGTDNPTQ